MNQSRQSDTEALRSDIDMTRSRMDGTIDALGNRFQPRHLLDEVLGFFRRHEGEAEGKLSQVRESLSLSSEAVMHTAVDTIKKNPIPFLLIGAGIGWMIYSNRKDNAMDVYDYDDEDFSGDVRYDPDAHIDRPLDYPGSAGFSESAWSEEGESKMGHLKDTAAGKLSRAREEARRKMEGIRHTAGDKLQAARQRAGELRGRMKERGGEVYSRTRQRVAGTADQHPLEVGLVCLATGLVAGLMLPTTDVVNRTVGEKADRLRDRTREKGEEMLEKGKRVAGAAVSAVKEEAEAQGLTPEHLREKAGAVADRAKEAAREEGMSGSQSRSGAPSINQPNTPADPTVARPAV